MKKYALLSVYDKIGVVDFAKVLDQKGFRIISTGGTAKALTDNGISVVPIQEITGNPESFDGRMKTISFQIESGILFDRSNKKHVKQAEELGIKPIDLVVCNLYPFEQTVQKQNTTYEEIIESIDVGGPTMLRAAGKNYKSVLAVTDPGDYERVAQALEEDKITPQLRKELATKVFQHLSFYDSQIARYLSEETYPAELALPGRRSIELRYGENPHQIPAFVYFEPNTNSPLSRLEKRIGRELSYVNFTDIAAGLETVRMFEEPTAVVIKHNSPCGVALGKTAEEALRRAVEADPQSAFGGVVVLNKPIDEKTARAFADFKEDKVQMDIVAAPSMSQEAEDIIHGVRKTTGIYTFGEIPSTRTNPTHLRFFDGGFIAQPWDDDIEARFEVWECVTNVKPTKQQLKQMKVAWKFISRIRSNSVIVVDRSIPMTRGIGSGQTARILSTEIALKQAKKHVAGAILASDSFFPFEDSVTRAVERGIGAIVQQGGSINDRASIEVANRAGIPMIITKRRAFWH